MSKVTYHNNGLVLLLAAIFGMSCTNTAHHTRSVRIFTKVYPPAKYKFTGALIDNKKEGLWIKYDSLGKIESETTYVDGKEWGETKVYEDGVLAGRAKDTIIEKDTITYASQYNSSGKTLVSGQYVNGVKNGIWKYYQNDGKKLKKVENYTKTGVKILYKDTITKNQDY